LGLPAPCLYVPVVYQHVCRSTALLTAALLFLLLALAGLAKKYLGKRNIAITMYGDGAANQGQKYEALNMSGACRRPAPRQPPRTRPTPGKPASLHWRPAGASAPAAAAPGAGGLRLALAKPEETAGSLPQV
jgi:hypothetical protein